MKRAMLVALLSVFAVGAAWAQETCESKAVDKNGQPLAGAARTSFLELCRRNACASRHGASSDLAPVQIKTGIVRRKGRGNQVSSLKIEADAGNYAIKLVEKKSNTEVLMILIGANQSLETKMALGTYKILGTTGDVWYGEKDLFGPCASYFVLRRSSEISFAGGDEFQFVLKGNTYHGHHIRLQKAVDGNLSTESIRPSEFQQQ